MSKKPTIAPKDKFRQREKTRLVKFVRRWAALRRPMWLALYYQEHGTSTGGFLHDQENLGEQFVGKLHEDEIQQLVSAIYEKAERDADERSNGSRGYSVRCYDEQNPSDRGHRLHQFEVPSENGPVQQQEPLNDDDTGEGFRLGSSQHRQHEVDRIGRFVGNLSRGGSYHCFSLWWYSPTDIGSGHIARQELETMKGYDIGSVAQAIYDTAEADAVDLGDASQRYTLNHYGTKKTFEPDACLGFVVPATRGGASLSPYDGPHSPKPSHSLILPPERRVALAEYRRGLEHVFAVTDNPGVDGADYGRYSLSAIVAGARTNAFVRGATDGLRAKTQMVRAEKTLLTRKCIID